MAAAQQFETITMPEGGLGSFFTSNMDEFDDNVLMFGREGGINSMKEVADRMARMGREGDNFVVHASEKEVMVPKEVAEKNPELVGQIKQAIAAEGADPEAYVVGSDRNSINPYTGQREFFLKKLVKGIKKVFKKAAKVILPVALNVIFPGMGTIASAAIGAGIGGLVQGASLSQAFKSAALGGLTAGVASGVSGALGSIGTGQTLGQGFMSGLKGALPSQSVGFFKPRFGMENAPGVFEPFKTGRGMDANYQNMVAGQRAIEEAVAPTLEGLNPSQLEHASNLKALNPDLTNAQLAEAASKAVPAAAAKSSVLGTAAKYGIPSLLALGATGAFDPIPASEIDLTDVGGSDLSGALADATDMVEADPSKYRVGQPTGRPEYVDPAFTLVNSGLTSGEYLPSQGQYVPPARPSAVYASLVPSGAGTANQDTGTMVPSGDGQFATYVPPAAPVVIPGYNPEVTGMRPAPIYGIDSRGNPVMTPYGDPIMPAQFVGSNQEVQMAAAGGPMELANDPRLQKARMFPRRTGQIQGPGTETSDDIPAMLSDGEFVMTAQAVRGAGNGSREQGFKKMYDIMRAFEGGAVA